MNTRSSRNSLQDHDSIRSDIHGLPNEHRNFELHSSASTEVFEAREVTKDTSLNKKATHGNESSKKLLSARAEPFYAMKLVSSSSYTYNGSNVKEISLYSEVPYLTQDSWIPYDVSCKELANTKKTSSKQQRTPRRCSQADNLIPIQFKVQDNPVQTLSIDAATRKKQPKQPCPFTSCATDFNFDGTQLHATKPQTEVSSTSVLNVDQFNDNHRHFQPVNMPHTECVGHQTKEICQEEQGESLGHNNNSILGTSACLSSDPIPHVPRTMLPLENTPLAPITWVRPVHNYEDIHNPSYLPRVNYCSREYIPFKTHVRGEKQLSDNFNSQSRPYFCPDTIENKPKRASIKYHGNNSTQCADKKEALATEQSESSSAISKNERKHDQKKAGRKHGKISLELSSSCNSIDRTSNRTILDCSPEVSEKPLTSDNTFSDFSKKIDMQEAFGAEDGTSLFSQKLNPEQLRSTCQTSPISNSESEVTQNSSYFSSAINRETEETSCSKTLPTNCACVSCSLKLEHTDIAHSNKKEDKSHAGETKKRDPNGHNVSQKHKHREQCVCILGRPCSSGASGQDIYLERNSPSAGVHLRNVVADSTAETPLYRTKTCEIGKSMAQTSLQDKFCSRTQHFPTEHSEKLLHQAKLQISEDFVSDDENSESDPLWIDTSPQKDRSKRNNKSKKNQVLKNSTMREQCLTSGKEFNIFLRTMSTVKSKNSSPNVSVIQKKNKIKAHKSGFFRAEITALIRDYAALVEKADACRKSPAARLLLLQEALPLAEEINDIPMLHEQLLDMSELYNEVGEFRKAQECAERVLLSEETCSSQKQNRIVLLRCNAVLGRSFESLVQPEKAKPFLDAAIRLSREIGDKHREAAVMGHLGIVHELMGDYTTAFLLYAETLRMAQSLKDLRILCETTANLGLAHLSIGDLDAAHKLLMNNVPVARSLRDYTLASRALTNVAHVHLLRGDLEKAKYFHREELLVNEENQDSQGVAQALSCLGNVCKTQGEYDEASSYFLQELCVVQRLGNDIRVLESLSNCGTIFRLMKDFNRARDYHRRERVCAGSTSDVVVLAKAILNLADVDSQEGMYQKMPVLLQTAIERYHRTLYLVCEGVPHDERQLYMIKVGCCEAEWRALDGLETAHRYMDDIESAVWRADAKHLPLVTQILRRELDKPMSDSSGDLVSRLSIDVEKRISSIMSTEPISQISTPSTDQIRSFLARKFLSYDIRFALNEMELDTIVLYSMYWDDGHDLHAYVFHRTEQIWHTVPLIFSTKSSKVLAAQNGTYRRLLVDTDLDMPLLPHTIYSKGERLAAEETPENLQESMTVIYNDFIYPLETVLKRSGESNSICFVTDGLLINIPFAVLQDYEGRYLIERYAINTVPSLEQLVLLHERRKSKRLPAQNCPAQNLSIQRNFKLLCLTGSSNSFPSTSIFDFTNQRESFDINEKDPKCSNRAHVNSRLVNESDWFQHHYCCSVEYLHQAMMEPRELVLLHFPTDCEMREDYTGSFVTGENQISSEEIVTSWKSLNIGTIVCDGFSSFSYRVIHESCVGLTRSLLAVGADRILGLHWLSDEKFEEFESNLVQSSCRHAPETEPGNSERTLQMPEDPWDAAQSYISKQFQYTQASNSCHKRKTVPQVVPKDLLYDIWSAHTPLTPCESGQDKALTSNSEDTEKSPLCIARILQKYQIKCIKDGISPWIWGRYTIIGLP